MSHPPARDAATRKADTLSILAGTVDTWVATADGDQEHMVPLTFSWDGFDVVVATPESSITARNIVRNGHARCAFGAVRDVVLIDVSLERSIAVADAPDVLDHYVSTRGDDPSTWGEGYVFLVLRPQRIQAWREANEIAGRTVLRDGTWLV